MFKIIRFLFAGAFMFACACLGLFVLSGLGNSMGFVIGLIIGIVIWCCATLEDPPII